MIQLLRARSNTDLVKNATNRGVVLKVRQDAAVKVAEK